VSLSIQVQSTNGTVVVALAGTADAPMLKPLLEPLSAALLGAQTLVLDLDQLTLSDAAPLRELVVALLDNAHGGQLTIAAGHDHAVGALTASRVHHLVPIHRSVADAIGHPTQSPGH